MTPDLEPSTVVAVRTLLGGVHRRLDGGPEERHGDPMAADVIVHFDPGGDHELADTYVGVDGRRRMTGLLLELSGGTIQPEVHAVVGGPDWAVMTFTITAAVDSQSFSWIATSEFRFEDGLIVEDWIRPHPRHEVERFIDTARTR